VPDFDSAGIRIHYELHGPEAGQPIVLVHGYASSYRLNWVGSRWQETLVESGRRVIGVDCRGHGLSEKPHQPEAYERGEMADDVWRLIDHLGLDAADYLGYSMGSWIGLQLMVRHGERVGRAVLGGIGTDAGRGFSSAPAIARRMRGDTTVSDPVALTFHAFAAANPENDLEALAAYMEARQQKLADADLAAIRNPVLIVTGDLDEIAGGASRLADRLPSAELVMLPGRNHMNAVPARQFKEAAVAFLNQGRSA
jgi:pimeloyl-ACP methyl ester carboxylesterase